ncbi:MAG: iron-containing alcohol dehydrogenase [Pseudomonadota bacterium]
MDPFRFETVPAIRMGAGLGAFPDAELVEALGPKILFVTDCDLVALGLVAPALEALRRRAEVVVFDAVEADPSRDTLDAAVASGQACGATGVIGFGGGSPMDVAKLAALRLRSDDVLDDIWGVDKARGPRLPLVLVPTTAGTGSEVTPVSIITVGRAEKRGVVSRHLLPDLAILDPDLTLGLPPAVTAATGIDAMVHAIEAYTSASANNNPVSRLLAIEALRNLAGSIERAVTDGSDRDARAGMLLGATLAGQAFANSPVAAVHALAYPLGGHFKIPHGLSNALVLPEVMRFTLPAATEAYAALGPVAFPDLPPGSPAERAGAFIDALAALSARLGLPPRLRDAGVDRASLPMLAAEAMKQTRLLVNNPRPVLEADARTIYEAAW